MGILNIGKFLRVTGYKPCVTALTSKLLTSRTMLNHLWLSFFLVSFLYACGQWLLGGNLDIFAEMVKAVFESAKLSLDVALGLVGILCFWLGLMKIAEKAGLTEMLARLLSPLLSKLMPEIPKNHPAIGCITMNFAANMLGLDNAATPMGLKAMQHMQELNPSKDTASNAQILFLVLNASSLTLLPVTIFMYRAQLGASDPTAVFIPILLATSASTLTGLLTVAWMQRLPIFDKTVLAYLGGAAAIVASMIWYFGSLPKELQSSYSSFAGNFALMAIIIWFLIAGAMRKVPVYETFVEGAKEGFELALKILPYLVAMLVAVGVLRASGVFELALDGIKWCVAALGMNTDFVPALPTALIKPFSGSGARAMMIDTMKTYGADSFPATIAAIIQGSTETTFYVLSVYFGAVNIARVRHAVGCALLADLAGAVAAVLIGYWFFV